MQLTSSPLENSALTRLLGRPVIIWDVLSVPAKSRARLTFLQKNSPRRQGVWIRCDGGMVIGGKRYSTADFWEDAEPESVEILLEEGNKLHLYNIWEGKNGRSSQAHTSGLLVDVDGTVRRYSCCDYGEPPDFSRLVFQIEINPADRI